MGGEVTDERLSSLICEIERCKNRRQIAKVLGVSEATVSKYWRDGRLKSFKFKQYRLSSDEHLAEFLSKKLRGEYNV